MSSLIRITNISKTFGEGASAVHAVTNVSLAFAGRQLTLLMGPSGSGKTTLLSIMGCILTPSDGSVEVAGTSAAGLDEQALARLRLANIGFIFQAYNLFPTLTAKENVLIALSLLGVIGPDAEARALQSLAEVGLSDKADTFPSDLSGGQKQRVAIARALAGEHRVLLADEPTAALDSATGRTVMQLLARLAHERGHAVVVVTHDPRLLDFADRVVTMEDGRVVTDNAGAARIGESSHA